jgi:tetratricopeptide (TPR) repeat protein
MAKTVLISALAIGFLMIPFLIHAEVYKWVDDKGTIHFTDDYSNIPSSYREQLKVEIRRGIQEEETPLEPQKIILRSKEEQAKTDLYRQEEAWWRGKVSPWKKQLNEASENYELTNKEFLGESSNLIIRKFGSHQQFKSTILRMDRIKEERSKHEAQIIEAEGMLEKVTRQAEESKADPSWLTGASVLRLSTSLFQEEISTDIYGRDEAWWRSKVFDQREQLKKAVEDYEKAYEDYSEHVEKLSPSRLGRLSLTQYQMFSCRLDILSKEMTRHRVRVTEANELLKRLLKEAEESKANPEWLRQ